MYLPRHFAQDDPAVLRRLMAAYPLATLFSRDAEGPTADHLPLLFDPTGAGQGVLRGHVARANPLWRQAPGQDVLAVFLGPEGYVSPSWYPSKDRHHKVVPTWNYAVVHARGRLRVVDDPTWLRALVTRLTQSQESHRPAAWAVDDAPGDYLAQMLQAIVGIEIELTGLTGKFKLSQNRDAADRAGVVTALEAEGRSALADAVSDAEPPPPAPAG